MWNRIKCFEPHGKRKKKWFWRRKLTFSRDIFQVWENFLFFHTVDVEYLHSDRFFEFSKMLYLIHEITTVDEFHYKVQSVLKNSKIVTENPKIFTLCTMLKKLWKCEVKAWLCCNLIILPPLRFYVKSNFGNFRGSQFLFQQIWATFKSQIYQKFNGQSLWNCQKWLFWTVWMKQNLISRKIGVAVKLSNFDQQS